MSEGEVRSMAAERFGVPADRIWRQHLPNVITVKAHELDFVDIVFEQGRAVAVQRGNYVAFTTGMDFGEVRRLCGDAPQDGSRFRKPAAP